MTEILKETKTIDVGTPLQSYADEGGARFLIGDELKLLGFSKKEHLLAAIRNDRLQRAVELALEMARLDGRLEGIHHVIYERPLVLTEHGRKYKEENIESRRK